MRRKRDERAKRVLEQQRQHEAVGRIEALMRDRAEQGDRAFAEEIERRIRAERPRR